MSTRFPIRFGSVYRLLSSALLLRPSDSFVDIGETDVEVRMGWGFRARFPRASVARTSDLGFSPLSRGVHGFAGRWLVNGSGDKIVVLDFDPAQQGYVLGVPVSLRQLMISLEDPAGFSAALAKT